ncbi:hypothetical protein PINS_up004915 [Pythium insidiosum]|nr:hypothetical protein PINS_up004915 [Pythium insidiosum]
MRVQLRPLYVCSCEENKLQSVLHAVAAHGQREIVALLLAQIVNEQRDPSVAAQIVPRAVPKLRKQTDHLARRHKGNAIVPSRRIRRVWRPRQRQRRRRARQAR